MLQRRDSEILSGHHQKLREKMPANSVPQLHTNLHGFQKVNQTGVIYVMARATENGYFYGNEEWANLGQGAPEVGPLEGAPERSDTVRFTIDNSEYAPVAGTKELRQKVADLYNHRYRQGKESKYTWENVCISNGGRSALTRLAASIGNVNVGYFLPDYTAYEEMLNLFTRFVAIPNTLDEVTGYRISVEELKKEIKNRGLSVVLISNPCNPTGHLIEGEELRGWVKTAREQKCTIIMDEFYSHYVYTHSKEENGRSVSAAEFVDDVDEDPVIMIDGLTKNFRCPGWRVCWTVGPKDIIASLLSAGSFLDGGASHPLQDAALPLLDPDFVEQDAQVLQHHFREKRDYVLKRLENMGIEVEWEPQGTFYIWANLKNLPHGLDDGVSFFEEALLEKVIVVPGIFFDINPGKRRELFHSPYHSFVRISFGPPMRTLQSGMDALERLIQKFTDIDSPLYQEN